MTDRPKVNDGRHHVESMLMRESLVDKDVQRSTETPVFRMLPEAHVIKIGGRSVMDAGRAVVYPVVEALAECLKTKKLIIGTGGGVRSRHVFSIGIDLGLPTGVLAVLALGAAVFATFSLIIACLVKTRERFMGIGQILTMPLFFASNAIYPLSLMPDWLRVISYINPLSYEVDALRALMLQNGVSSFGLAMDYAVLLITTIVLVMIGARLYPRVVL